MPFARQLMIAFVAIGMSTIAAATPPIPPPPPRPFDDHVTGERYGAWNKNHVQLVNDAASKLARARLAIRADAGANGVRVESKIAANEFATGRRKTLESLRALNVIYDQAQASASSGDLQELRERLDHEYRWFVWTETNTLEILDAISK